VHAISAIESVLYERFSDLSPREFRALHFDALAHSRRPRTMTHESIYRLAPPLVALQFLAFGWSVNREINVDHADRQPVIPLPDVINIMSLFTTVGSLFAKEQVVSTGRESQNRRRTATMKGAESIVQK